MIRKNRWNIITLRDNILRLLLMLLPLSLLFPFRIALLEEYLLIITWITAHVWKSKNVSFRIDRLTLSFFAFYLILVISLIYSANVKHGFLKLQTQLGLVVYPLVLSTLVPYLDPKLIKRSLIIFVIAVVMILLITEITILPHVIHSERFSHRELYIWQMDRIFSIHMADYSVMLLITILFLYSRVLRTKSGLALSFMVVFLIILGLWILYTGSMISKLVLGVLVFSELMRNLFIFLRKKQKLYAYIITCILIIAGLSGIVFIGRGLSVPENLKTDTRTQIWPVSWSLIKKAPILGYGIGDYGDVMVKALEEQSLFRLSEEKLNSHNQYLNILLISGFTGLLIFFLILLFNAVKLIRDKNIFGFWIELTFILYFMTEASLLRYKGVGLFAIFMALSHYYASFEYDKGKTAES